MKKLFITLTASMLFVMPLYVSAHESTSSPETPHTEPHEEVLIPVKTFTTCSQDAIEKRDTNIAISRSEYNIAMNNALLERKNNEKLAVGSEEKGSKKTALKNGAEAYKNKVKSAQNTLTQARKLAWQTFDDDVKNCREDQKEEISAEKEILKTALENETGKSEDISPKEGKELKALKETFKAQLETLKSFFK